MVADDILLIFKNNYASCKQVEEELVEFSINSGLKVNPDKCTISRINNAFLNPETDLFPQFQRKQDHIQYIGLHTNFKQEQLWESNITKIVDQMLAELSVCGELFSMTPLGRVNIIKSLFYSRLPYFFELVVLPNSQYKLQRIQESFSQCIWNGRKPKMKKVNTYALVKEGGLGMFDVSDVQMRYKAIKIAILQQAVDTQQLQFGRPIYLNFLLCL